MNDDEPVFRVEIQATSLSDLRAFTSQMRGDLGCRPVARQVAEGYSIDAFLTEPELDLARGTRAVDRVRVRVVANQSDIGAERQKEVSQGNRYAIRGEVPRGLGSKE